MPISQMVIILTYVFFLALFANHVTLPLACEACCDHLLKDHCDPRLLYGAVICSGWSVKVVKMSDIKEITEVGKSLGLSDLDLLDFIKTEREYQKEQRKEQERREKELWQHQADERRESERLAKEERAYNRELRRQEAELLELQLKLEESKVSQLDSKGELGFNPVRARAPKLPFFDDDKDDIDSYLHRFERYAKSQDWDPDTWAINL